MKKRNTLYHLLGLLSIISSATLLPAQEPVQAGDILQAKYCTNPIVHPNGEEVIYAVSSPRGANEEAGPARLVWFRQHPAATTALPLFPENIKAASPQYSPDGKYIGFLHAKEGESRQVWLMPLQADNAEINGKQMIRLTNAEGGVSAFCFQPGSYAIAYLAQEAESARDLELKKRGYGFIFYEENLRNNQLYLASYNGQWQREEDRRLKHEGHAWDLCFNAQGTQIALSISPKNLIDHRYMFRHIYLYDLATDSLRKVSENEGKLGNYAFSPNGRYLAYAAALNINDHQVSQAFVCDLETNEVLNLTPPDFRGHVKWVDWEDDEHLLFLSAEGVYSRLSSRGLDKTPRQIILDGKALGIVFHAPASAPAKTGYFFSASSPTDPSNLYLWKGKGLPKRITDLNPSIAERKLGKQEVIHYKARDGKEIEGLMIYPVAYKRGESYPLIVYVHGGPESHYSNDWLSRYSRPGQFMAGKGYLVLYPNYRASTGYGVDFAMEGFEDPAGKEFDDLADGIEWAIRTQGADRNRVGMAGGSYGGYASAWFATYYTSYVKAVCMFVGISNVVSKRGTTDIAWEELYVHSGKLLEDMWQLSLERSPVYWAHQSKTATLIYGGAADTRVHPSQSMELYRRMKMNQHPAVRLVQYPGEGHGNRKQVGQIDVLNRQAAWFDWYVRDARALDGPMPPLDISDSYGLNWDKAGKQ